MDSAIPEKPVSKIRRWIFDNGNRCDDGSLAPDTPLLEDGYIDSLGLIGLIVLIEKLRGTPISENEMSVHNFTSLRRIEGVFFPGDAATTTAQGSDGNNSATGEDHA